MKAKLEKSNVQEIFELNAVQKGMLYHYVKDTNDNLYNVQLSLQVNGTLNKEALQQAVQLLQHNNESLRSVFSWEIAGKPLQIILKNCALPVHFYDLSHNKAEDLAYLLQQYGDADWHLRFDLHELPVRMQAIILSDQSFVFNVTCHHILYDGWSNGLLLNELFTYYTELINDKEPAVLAKPLYKEVYRSLQQKIKADNRLYWQRYLSGCRPGGLFLKHYIESDRKDQVKKQRFDASDADPDRFAKNNKVTKAAVVYAAYGILLYKYGDSSDVVFGTTVSERDPSISGIDTVIGNFINIVPLRLTNIDKLSLLEVVKYVNNVIVERNEYNHVSYADIREWLGIKTTESLYDSVVAIENYPVSESSMDGKFPFTINLRSVYENTSIPLVVNVFLNRGPEIEFMYKPRFISDACVQSLAGNFINILNDIVYDPHKTVDSILLLMEQEEYRLSKDFNKTATAYPAEETVIDLIEKQVSRTPGNIAYSFAGRNTSYQELKVISDAIAVYLKEEQGVSAGDVVALLLDRNEYVIPFIIGVLKSGAAYIPIEAAYPAERIQAIVDNAGAKVFITDKQYTNKLMSDCLQVIDMDALLSQLFLYKTNQPAIELKGADLAYIIYTSGSTGQPKGVMVGHQSLLNYVYWAAETYVGSDKAAFPLFTSLSFDLTVTSIFTPLITGNRIFIYEEEKVDVLIDKILSNKEVNIIKITPSHLKIMRGIHHGQWEVDNIKRKFIVGGEELTTSLALHIFNIFKGRIEIFNEYGPTEATVGCMIHRFDPEETLNAVPLGTPIHNSRIYILNRQLHPVPAGVEGEMYIAGDGLAKGYVNNSAATIDKFIVNPADGKKMYRTGDLAVRCLNGKILYKGRIDDQIKINGYRIEIGEIEAVLTHHTSIREVAVVARQHNGEQYLAAYYVADKKIDRTSLKEFLSNRLPAYMVPPHFIHLQKMPLTTNGKLDKKALPDPLERTADVYEPPANETEEILVDIWADVLKLPKAHISVNKSFLDMGGHSLKIIVMLNRVNKLLHVLIPVNDFFNCQDIRNLAQYIHSKNSTRYSIIEKAPPKEYYKLSFSQKRVYFLYEFDKLSLVYNGGLIYRLGGEVDIDRMNSAFRQLIARHEILHTAFVVVNEEPVQKVIPQVSFSVEYIQPEEDGIDEVVNAFIRPFDLEKPPLMRVGLIHLGQQQHLFIADVHHIIGDAVSQEILVKDFMSLYNGETLAPLPLQYTDFAEWEQSKERIEEIGTQKTFWLNEFADEVPLLDLPVDFVRPSVKTYEGAMERIELSDAETSGLKRVADLHNTTLFTVIFSIYNILLSKLSAQQDIIVGVSVAGRSHAELESMAGIFINTLPLRTYLPDGISFRELLVSVRSKMAKCFDHQNYPYALLIDDLDITRNTSRNPLFDVMFVFQHVENTGLTLPGITIQPYHKKHAISKFDITLAAFDRPDGIALEIEYATALFKKETIEQFISYFRKIGADIVDNIDIKIRDITCLTRWEENELVYNCNNTASMYPSNETIVSLFKQQVQKTPDRVAVRFKAYMFTYSELDRLSDVIAHNLIQHAHVAKRDVVGILLPRDQFLIPVIVGVLKTGATYVPIDTSYPAERIHSIIGDAGLKALLLERTMASPAPDMATLVFIDELIHEHDGYINETLLPLATSDDLAYIIYTSGSTGTPKGVMIEHRSVVNYINWAADQYLDEEIVTFPLFTSISFDLTVTSIFLPLLTGNEVLVYSEDEIRLVVEQVFADNRCHIIKLTPSHLKIIRDSELVQPSLNNHIKKLIVGGEELDARLAQTIYEKFNRNIVIYNEYGPTEATVGCMIHTFDPSEPYNSVPIGKPIDNTQLYVLDKNYKPVPAGVQGELYIAGDGLARGYTGHSKLTAEKFIDNPFIKGKKMYKTGDLAYRSKNGLLFFCGRLDAQVKIRGFRIELGEIKITLSGFDAISDALVVVKEKNGDKVLVAYYVSQTDISDVQLKQYIANKLPVYMIPPYFVRLERIPLTANGKVDKKALPDPELSVRQSHAQPINDIQRELVQIWAGVLELDPQQVGVYTNFFDLGGNSLKMIRMISKVNKHFNTRISVPKMFELPMIASIAAYLGKNNAAPHTDDNLEKDLVQMTNAIDTVLKLNN